MNTPFVLPVVTVDDSFVSIFSEEKSESLVRGGMILTEQISTLNLRLRKSAAGYKSDWHVAGDPTLIIINQGKLRIILRDESYKDFSAGDFFIAKDYLSEDMTFDFSAHGHRAEVIGDQDLAAVHIKLSSRA